MTEFQFQCTDKNWQDFRKKGTQRRVKRMGLKLFQLRLFTVFIMLCSILLIWWIASFYFHRSVVLVVEITFIVAIAAFFLRIKLENRILSKYRNPDPYGRVICIYDSTSVKMEKNGASTSIIWEKVCDMDLVDDSFLIWILPLQAWIIPVNDKTRPHIEKMQKIWQSKL